MASPAVCRFCQSLLTTQLIKHQPARSLASFVQNNSTSSTPILNHATSLDKWSSTTGRSLGIRKCLYSTATDPSRVIHHENNETIIRSHYRDVETVDKSFGEFMFSFLDKYKDLDAMVNFPTGETYTCGDMKEAAIKVASGLWRLGYRKGDVVILFAHNCPEYTILFLACGLLGMPVSTANPVYTPAELARQMSHSGAKTVVTMEAMLPTVREAVKSSQELSQNIKHVFTFDSSPDGCVPFRHLLADDGSEFPENLDIDPDNDILTLPYSSGTTGLPKGVMLTHKNMVMNLVQGMEGQMKFRVGEEVLMGLLPFYHIYGLMVLQFGSLTQGAKLIVLGQMKFRAGEEVLMGLLPFYHIYGLMVLQFGSLTQGAKLIVLPKFEPETFLQAIQDYKVTYAHLVPPVILFLAKHPMIQDYRTDSLHTLISAAAPLGTGVTLATEERLKCNLLQAYGLTECSPITHYDEYPHKRGTIGRLVPSTRAKIIDCDTGKNVGVGETGEILLQGPQVMKGYYKNQAATDDCIRDGWFYTGDIGHADHEGYFIISDRLKELIKYKGFQVAPAELEALLCTHPAIQDAAVIGLPAREEVGEVPKAFVVIKPGASVREREIIDFVANNVAPYKKLRGGLEYVDEIPKTASGKILRRMLK